MSDGYTPVDAGDSGWGTTYHRHSGMNEIHRDIDPCDRPSTKRQVFVFDPEYLAEREESLERAAEDSVLAELLPVLEDAVSNAYLCQNDRGVGDEWKDEIERAEAAVERARAAALGPTAGQEEDERE